MDQFKFQLTQPVRLVVSGECGVVIGRAEYSTAGNSYLVHYKAADGRATQCWWDEDQLEALGTA